MKEVIKIVGGGIGGIMIAMLILRFGFGEDPFAVLGLVADKSDATQDESTDADRDGEERESTVAKQKQPATDQPAADQPATDQTAADQTAADQIAADQNSEDQDAESVKPSAEINATEQVPRDVNLLSSGLLKFEFSRQSQQKGNDGFVHAYKLGEVVGDSKVGYDLRAWTFTKGLNAALVGFLRIDEPGTYVFRTYNYYDRNALYIDGQIVSPYRGSQSRGTDSGNVPQNKERIYLGKGLVPIVCVGYVDARGTVNVWWSRPGQNEYETIPQTRLSHDPDWATAKNAQEVWDRVHEATP